MAPTTLEALVARARAQPTTEHLQELWRAIFFRKAWYFLPSRADDGPAFPTATAVDGEPWLLAFTSVRYLEELADRTGRRGADGTVPLLVLDPGASMDRILAVGDHLAGVIFNFDTEATVRAPLHALEAYAHHFGVPLSPQ